MAEIRDISIPASTGPGPLAGRIYLPPADPRAAVVISHGLMSSMESEKLSLLARTLSLAGHTVVIFDHSGAGRSPGDIKATTLSGRAREVVAAAQWLLAEVGPRPLVLIGSSLGGSAVLMAARELTPACTVHWSTPWFFEPLLKRLGAQPPGQHLTSLITELRHITMEPLLSTTSNALIVHGENDEVVDVSQARRGYKLLQKPKALVVLPGADHRFTNPDHRRQAIEHTLEWISQRL